LTLTLQRCCRSLAQRSDLDIYNAGAPHLKKQAGCTPQERASFDAWLNPGGANSGADGSGGGGGAGASNGGSDGGDGGGGSAGGSGGVRDAFRHLHPQARGCYTYWSMRSFGVSALLLFRC
jgi:exonuclease III